MSGNKNLTSVKGHDSVTNVRKMMCNNPNLDLVNINVYTNFGEILKILSGNITLTSIRVHTSVLNLRKMTDKNSNLDLVNINAHTVNLVTLYQLVLEILSGNKKSDITQGPLLCYKCAKNDV